MLVVQFVLLIGLQVGGSQLPAYCAWYEGHPVIHVHEGHSDELTDWVAIVKWVNSCRRKPVLIRQYFDLVRTCGGRDV